jgi:hypothetical protein
MIRVLASGAARLLDSGPPLFFAVVVSRPSPSGLPAGCQRGGLSSAEKHETLVGRSGKEERRVGAAGIESLRTVGD